MKLFQAQMIWMLGVKYQLMLICYMDKSTFEDKSAVTKLVIQMSSALLKKMLIKYTKS